MFNKALLHFPLYEVKFDYVYSNQTFLNWIIIIYSTELFLTSVLMLLFFKIHSTELFLTGVCFTLLILYHVAY